MSEFIGKIKLFDCIFLGNFPLKSEKGCQFCNHHWWIALFTLNNFKPFSFPSGSVSFLGEIYARRDKCYSHLLGKGGTGQTKTTL